MRNFLAGFIGTFALVFCGTGAIVVDDLSGGTVTHVGISLTFGLIVLAMIYAIGDISGAHINPAVTFGFYLSGRFPLKHIFPYILSQFLGGVVASSILRFLFSESHALGETIPSVSLMKAFVLEVILTFILMFVIIHVATGSKETGTMAGIAIGSVVGLEALFAGPITGASMNPARSFGPAFIAGNWEAIWLYLTAPFIGAALAVLL